MFIIISVLQLVCTHVCIYCEQLWNWQPRLAATYQIYGGQGVGVLDEVGGRTTMHTAAPVYPEIVQSALVQIKIPFYIDL